MYDLPRPAAQLPFLRSIWDLQVKSDLPHSPKALDLTLVEALTLLRGTWPGPTPEQP